MQTLTELLLLYRDYCSWAGHTAGGAEDEPFTRTHQEQGTQGHFQPFAPKEAIGFPLLLSGMCPRELTWTLLTTEHSAESLLPCGPQGPAGPPCKTTPFASLTGQAKGSPQKCAKGFLGSFPSSHSPCWNAGMMAGWLQPSRLRTRLYTIDLSLI